MSDFEAARQRLMDVLDREWDEDRCEACGEILRVGDFPFCPHGRSQMNVIDDQIAGGARYFENLGHEPVWIESKSQLRDEMRARGLRSKVEHVGVPGSDKSPETQRWV